VLQRVPRFVDPATQVAEGSLLAPMPGTVVAVHVAVGDGVGEGQPLLVMEAMKMQHTIVAPQAGTVAELAASVGQQVEAGVVLAVVSTGSTGGEGSTGEVVSTGSTSGEGATDGQGSTSGEGSTPGPADEGDRHERVQ
jgi:pyruvate/2-oxoglutarate dehydrogenase complex dihydrolipoamide acyltransferase (E2) component